MDLRAAAAALCYLQFPIQIKNCDSSGEIEPNSFLRDREKRVAFIQKIFVGLVLSLCLSVAIPGGSSAKPGASSYPVTQVLVKKADRKLYLLNGKTVLRSYDVELGFNPEGHKKIQGDGRTPEGLYYISHRNPNSTYHLSLGVSYPNAQDTARARKLGKSPGGDIFIHGRGRLGRQAGKDWTAGCIAVDDDEIEEIYKYVTPGIPILITP
jgi:murein L,D-transpeptidase YafK